MARYEHLPVYKAVYDLNLYFFKLSNSFPKDFKYGLAQEVRGLLTELLDLIIIANNSRDKLPALQKASLTIERMKFKVRLLYDLKVINICANYETAILSSSCFTRLCDLLLSHDCWLCNLAPI